ncbi:MAG TPA: MltA domain-containing protein [Xanthobacteraceae bacterium]|nr:MltA domain-containing protein [Xanthobacteraceae bacterium]
MALPPACSTARIASAALLILCMSSAAHGQDTDPLRIPDTQLEPLSWTALDGWASDDHIASFSAFLKSCTPFLASREPHEGRPIHTALWHVCRRAASLRPTTAGEAQAFFEGNFLPVAIARIGESKGLLTGYFEPVVDGSRFPNPEFSTPLYRRPRDLLVAGRPVGKADIPNRATINRRNPQGELVPYYDRAEIENGALDGQHLEICWLRDPFDAFSIQIQGSARVRLEDGTMLRVNYDGHNGHPYAAVGRILMEQYGVPPDQMSMERIRQWMLANPEQAAKVRQANPSFVFFRVTGLSDQGEAVGAQGVPLSPGRSIAVDKLHVYGTPFFIQADLPIDSDKPVTKFRRLMIAQDTGSAINGPARADLYWGAGDTAGRIAGRIRQQGQFVMLLPRELDMVEAGKHTALPLPKPAIADVVATKEGAPAGKPGEETHGAAAEPRPSPHRSHQPPEPISRRQARIRSKSGT